MLVVCGRCDTEYEFDDALLSERGTTVKCTNCGYQFRVRPPRGLRPTTERWVVRNVGGGPERVFGSLRDLRKAIDERTVDVEDELSRDGGPFRPIRSVAELVALFRRVMPGPAAPYGQTLMGVGAVQGDENEGSSLPAPAPPAPRTSPLPARPSLRPGVNPPQVSPSMRPGVAPPMVGPSPRPAGPPPGPRVSAIPAVAPPPRINPPLANPPPIHPRTAPIPVGTSAQPAARGIPSPEAITARPPPGTAPNVPQMPQGPGVPRVSIPVPVPVPATTGPSLRPTPLRPAALSAAPAGTVQGLAPQGLAPQGLAPQGLAPQAGLVNPGGSVGPVPTQPSAGAFARAGVGESLVPGTQPAGMGRTPLPPKGVSFPPTRRSEPAERPTPLVSEGTHPAYSAELAQQRAAGAPPAGMPQHPMSAATGAVNPAWDQAPTTPKVRSESGPIVAGTWGSPVGSNATSEPAPVDASSAAGDPDDDSLGEEPTIARSDSARPDYFGHAATSIAPVAASGAPGFVGAPAGVSPQPAPVQFASVAPSRLESWPVPGTPQAPAASLSSRTPTAPFEFAPPRRKTGGMRWVLGLVFVGALAVVAGTAGKDYLMRFTRPKVAAVSGPVSDAVASAQTAFQKGQFEKARAVLQPLSANEPAMKVALAELALAEADVEWLRVRLLAADDAKRPQAEQLLATKIRAVQGALGTLDTLGDGDPRRRRVEVETLRLQGRLPAARDQVERLTIEPSDSDASYALGMLDLAEAEPPWTRVVSRFSQLVGHEGAWGHARPALIFALLRSGDATRAKAELEQLAALAPEHPLLADLQAAVATGVASVSSGAATNGQAPGAPGQGVAGVADAPSNADGAPASDTPGGPSGVKGDAPMSFNARQLLEGAAAARASGDLAGAKTKYQQALAASPGNLAALSGLGGVARLEGKYQEAKTFYDQVLDRNPDYPAALVGGADVRWLMGAREGAVVLYRKISAGNPFHSHAQHRIEEFEGKSGAPGAAADPGTKPEPAKPPGEAAPKPPEAEPKADAPKAEAPKAESPKPDAPAPEAPKPAAPKDESGAQE